VQNERRGTRPRAARGDLNDRTVAALILEVGPPRFGGEIVLDESGGKLACIVGLQPARQGCYGGLERIGADGVA
jgi:hypothetical protein